MTASPAGLFSLPELIEYRAESSPDRRALHAIGEGTTTWAELLDRSLRWADVLASLGIKSGDVVATMLRRGVEPYVSWAGTAWLGAYEAPLNHGYRGTWLSRPIARLRPTAVVIDSSFWDAWAPLLSDLDAPVIVTNLPAGHPAESLGPAMEHRLAEASPARPSYRPDLGDPSSVILTSGTTGPSKGVLVPWGRCLSTVRLAEQLDPDADGTYYSPFPAFHWTGRGPIYRAVARDTDVVIRESFKTDRWLPDVREHGCTDSTLIGAMLNFLMKSPTRGDDADNPMRAVIATPVPANIDEFRARFGIERVITTYAMSEASNVFITPPGESVSADIHASCGKPSGYPIRVFGEDGKPVGPGVVGELQVGGDRAYLNAGYVNDPEATARAWTDDGWFRTGDLFRYDEENNFYFVDRLKDALRRRGENISSFEVEEAVLTHPEVAECAVVAVPSEWSEDDVMLFAVRVADAGVDEAALLAYLEPRLPVFALPQYVEFVTELPKTPSLKIQKGLLRDRGVGPNTWSRPVARRAPRPTSTPAG